jgi:prevent-host-death family protein
MQTVGVRELKARLSEHLRRVQAGERLVITDRGRAIASLVPADESARPAWLMQLVAEGRASWGGGKPVGLSPRVRVKGRSVSDAVIEDRR